ncbi:hypothetical protein B0I35DRAFT_175643 [Stachybotrys elegans]|uniref:SPIN90/Ldb17 leucine-rich domain-containing protein n=1 Tax=Stachybotrys elegans TaxID=80388 RepID=A0A8K0SWU2_9HYPO|nr:hypothetical protein B0I35DRAFT_175643 [Stachybotrys elegans]
MADFDVVSTSSEAEEEQFWKQLEACTSTPCDSHESIDGALRSWLDIASKLPDRSPDSETHDRLVLCACVLLESKVYREHKDYVRTQIIYSLLQEDEVRPLHAITRLLLQDGLDDESLFSRMVSEACFPRLLELIKADCDDDPRLHQVLLQLMYEMSRIERLSVDHLTLVDDEFVHYLFRLIEHVSNDVNDPYHYPTIRVLYMLASTDAPADSDSNPLTNRIVKCLSLHGPSFRTFGENIILLLNRETETSLQLLILKLLYLLFTTKATYEYFYTNDLRVLLDVIIRNVLDLPYEKISLRHTYLRVLHPLLAHTQLKNPPHYKKDEILRAIHLLRGSQNVHFAPADDTTLRLVNRVAKVPWLDESVRERQGSGEVEVARKLIGISLSRVQSDSSISVSDVAGVMEKPGVQTPSRAAEEAGNGKGDGGVKVKKPSPIVPKHRHGIPFAQNSGSALANGGAKKIPPKAPPPRRAGRMKTMELSPTDSTSDKAIK